MDTPRPIIIVKKKINHGGHHGGAWKVAYADFVTAMMALFIVLWLMNTSKPAVKEAIAGYFKDPSGTGTKTGTSMDGKGEKSEPTADMQKLKTDLEHSLQKIPDFAKLKNQVEMTITPEGLRIELMETASGTFFDLGSPLPNEHGRDLLILLAQQLGKLPNTISVEGHTDSTPYAGKGDYGNWELSADRANAARRLMQQKGLGEKQVTQVRGYADQMLRTPNDPSDPSNRRISVIVQYEGRSDGTGPQPAESGATEKKLAEPPKPSPQKKE